MSGRSTGTMCAAQAVFTCTISETISSSSALGNLAGDRGRQLPGDLHPAHPDDATLLERDELVDV